MQYLSLNIDNRSLQPGKYEPYHDRWEKLYREYRDEDPVLPKKNRGSLPQTKVDYKKSIELIF